MRECVRLAFETTAMGRLASMSNRAQVDICDPSVQNQSHVAEHIN